MYTLIIILIILASLLMVGIVLIQESKGGGLASGFSSSNQIMGVRKTTDIVEKLTWGFAVGMVVLSILSAYVAPKATQSGSVIENAATQQAPVGSKTLPGFGASQAPVPSKDAAAPTKEAETPAAEVPATPAK